MQLKQKKKLKFANNQKANKSTVLWTAKNLQLNEKVFTFMSQGFLFNVSVFSLITPCNE